MQCGGGAKKNGILLKGVLGKQYQLQKVMLNFDNQPLMLGKVVVEGLGLTNENLKRCPY
jgi:hypothetical protein